MHLDPDDEDFPDGPELPEDTDPQSEPDPDDRRGEPWYERRLFFLRHRFPRLDADDD